MDPATLWAFAGASLLLAAAPGPDNLFVLTQSAVYGVRAGLLVVAGLCLGLVLQTFCAALGLAALVAAVPALFWGIRLAGAAYLLYLAYMAWTHAVSDAGDGSGKTVGCGLSGFALVRRGFIMNVTNPKVQIFFLAFFPQFVPEGTVGTALVWRMVLQGLLFMGATLLVFSLIAWGAGTLAERLRSPKTQLLLNRGSALIFVMLAAATLVP